jgi:hypothetical protein
VSIRRGLIAVATALSLALPVAGCGFVGASKVSDTKPNGFVLRGAVEVSGAASGAVGSVCVAPPGVPDAVAGARVTVTDGNVQDSPRTLATGVLDPGRLVADARSTTRFRCDFPFAIYGVPGGIDSYGVAVGSLPPAPFEAQPLREDQPAIISLAPS